MSMVKVWPLTTVATGSKLPDIGAKALREEGMWQGAVQFDLLSGELLARDHETAHHSHRKMKMNVRAALAIESNHACAHAKQNKPTFEMIPHGFGKRGAA